MTKERFWQRAQDWRDANFWVLPRAPAPAPSSLRRLWPIHWTMCRSVRPAIRSDSDYYSLAAYLLNSNGVIPADAVLDKHTLPKVQMPNRNGFVPEQEFRQVSNSRQKK